MNEELKQLGQDLVEVFKKHGIEIVEGSLELKNKPYCRNYNNLVVQPMELNFERILSHYDDIYV